MSSGVMQFEGGISTLRVWQKGQLQRLMDQGKTLQEAQSILVPVHLSRVHNLITNAGKVLARNWACDTESTGLTYHAIGTGTTTPANDDTALVTEVQRKIFTNRTPSGYEVLFSCFYTAAQCTYDIQECGIFGGAAATAAADSGTLFSRYLQDYDNSLGNYDLTFDYVLKFKREGEA